VSTLPDGTQYLHYYTAPADALSYNGATMTNATSPITKTATMLVAFNNFSTWGNLNGSFIVQYETETGDNFTVDDTILVGAESHKLLRCNMVLDTKDTVFNNVKRMLSGMQGIMPYVQGQYSLLIEAAKSSSFDFDESHIKNGISIEYPRKKDKYNRVTCKYVNPNANWEEDIAIYPEPGSATETTLLAEDNDTPLHYETTLDTVSDYYQARDIARLILNRSRVNIRCSFVTTSEALELSVGDVVTVTHPTPGWVDKEFRITSMGLSSDGEVKLQMVEYDASIYTYESTDPDLLQKSGEFDPDPTGGNCYGALSLAAATGDETFGNTVSVTVPMDTADIAIPQGMTNDLANNGLVIDGAGTYQVDVHVSFTADASTASPLVSRAFRIALYNENDSAFIGPVILQSAGVNETSFSGSASFVADIPSHAIGDVLSLRIGGTGSDTFTGVEFSSAGIGLACLSHPPVIANENAYDTYIRNIIQPNLWIQGYRGIYNSGSGGSLTVTEYVAGLGLDFTYIMTNGGYTGAGAEIDGSGGAIQMMVPSDYSLWTEQNRGYVTLTDDPGVVNVNLIGAVGNSPAFSYLETRCQLILSRVGWDYNWAARGISASTRTVPSGIFGYITLSNAGGSVYASGNIDTTTWPMGSSGTYTQTDVSGPLFNVQMGTDAAYDTDIGEPRYGDFEISVRGHGGMCWSWTETTFVGSSAYSFGVLATYSATRFGLAANTQQILYSGMSEDVVIELDGGVLKVTHNGGTQHSLGTPTTEHIVVVFDNSSSPQTLTSYDAGVELASVSGVVTPDNTGTGEKIGNGSATGQSLRPIADPWQHMWHVDRALTEAEVLALYESVP